MKYSLSIATIICILLSYSSSKSHFEKQGPKVIKSNFQVPTVGKIANEYLVQNTVKFAIKNDIFKTDIDKVLYFLKKNPNKYQIINGLTASEDTTGKPSTIYQNDNKPYYDPTKPQQAEYKTKIPNQVAAKNRYINNIYPLDTVPYYSPSKPYRAIVNGAGDHFLIPAKLEELEEREASEKNIKELKKQLEVLNRSIEGPKFMTQDTKGRDVYIKDAGAYYDPTLADKRAKKASLQAQIASLTKEMNAREVPQLIIGMMKSNVTVQNFVNTNKEETNEFIAQSYYYPVDRRNMVYRNNTHGINQMKAAPVAVEPKKNQAVNIYTKTPEKMRVGSTNKYYEEGKNFRVEADSTGVTADKRFYYEDKKLNNEINAANKIPINNFAIGNKVPNTQGLKASTFRIMSLRKGN